MQNIQQGQDLSAALAQASSHNATLLSTLSQTDHAPAAVTQNASYVKDLEARIVEVDLQLRRLQVTTNSERQDHVKYRDSTFKRFAYKLGGSKGEAKFAEKASKEEREFLDAWQKERETTESREELGRALTQAEQDGESLKKDKERHDEAQRELDALYGQLFQGPTPELPGEDWLEEDVRAKGEALRVNQNGLAEEKRAAEALGKADKALYQANVYMQSAKKYSRRDVADWGMFNDMSERSALSDAQMMVNLSIQQVEEARRHQTLIRPLARTIVNQGDFFSDVLFDNIWSDLRQHERILQSEVHIQLAGQDVASQIADQGGRVNAAKRAVQDAAAALDTARKELQRVRAQAFEQYAANAFATPPAYAS